MLKIRMQGTVKDIQWFQRLVENLQFEYFRGMEAEQYHFYRVPKVLFTAECFKSLSCEAKVLYGLMLDRMSLSIKNRWFDEENRVYIIFTVEEIMELLGCARQKAIRNIAELDTEKGIGLIEKKRLGLGKPNVIYVKNFMLIDCPEPEKEEKQLENAGNMQKYENQTSESMKIELPEVPKSYSNKTDNIKTEYSDTEFNENDLSETEKILSNPILSEKAEGHPDGIDTIGKMDAYRELIRERIEYPCHKSKEVDELVDLVVEVLMMPDDSTLWIAGLEKPMPLVKSRFMKLDYSHIKYVLFSLQRNTAKVGNIKAYLLTILYNATMTMNHYYQAEVNHDLYGGG